MERTDLYQDDLTEERQPTPGRREDVAQSQMLDPDHDDEDEDDDDDDEDEDLED